MLFLTADIIKEAEKKAMENVSSMHLIENAAMAIFNELKGFSSVRVYCGKGNNGSDGYATALLLKKNGIRVEIVEVFEPSTEECRLLYHKAVSEEIPVVSDISFPTEEFDCVLDAVFGIGIKGEITDGRARRAIEMINSSDSFVISCDIPSGMDADTGKELGICVRADKTVTFTAPKRGMMSNDSVDLCGEIVTVQVGIAVDYNSLSHITCVPITKGLVKNILPDRPRNSHKGTFGTAVIVAGSRGMSGAAAMAAMAALRSGCGLVKIIAPTPICSVLNILVKEAIVIGVPEENGVMRPELTAEALEAVRGASGILVGPGLGKGRHDLLIQNILSETNAPVIIDADGINALSGNLPVIQNKNVLITPHLKEFSRITGQRVEELAKRQIKSADSFATENGVTVLLKGARTVIAYGGSNKYVSLGATSALSKAGSGDVLGGIIVSLASQGIPLTDSAAAGCFIHTGAGFLAERELGAYGVTADDLIKAIPHSIKEIKRY